MADAHHYASQGNQGNGAEAEFFGTQQARYGNIPGGFQLTVTFQRNPAAQTIHNQGLLGFSQAQFPGQAGMADGCLG